MIEVPKRLQARPTYGGYVVPYFVMWYRDGEPIDERMQGAKPDFRVVDIHRAAVCRKYKACWICGKQLGQYKWFVFGPSSALGRISMEPPSHVDCAKYAVQVCPYMLHPGKEFRTADTKEVDFDAYADMQPNNPGLVVLWSTSGYRLIVRDKTMGIYYYEPHEPNAIEFWREGRRATRAEIVAGIDNALDYNKLDRGDPDIAWRVEHLLRFAPE